MKSDGPLVMGIDGGTESLRAGIFDLEGNLIAVKSTPYKTYFLKSGWAEQDPEEWWLCLKKTVSELVRDSGIHPEAIKGICLDATSCTVVFLDREMKPIRNGLLWMDVRASKEAEFIAGTGHASLKYNGYGNVSAEWMPCKALWVKNNEPEHYRQAHTVCEYLDFINYRLTGRKTASINNTSIRWYYDDEEGGFPVSFYEAIGLEGIIAKFPRDVLKMESPVGTLTPQAAQELGLGADTIVAEGGADAFVGMIGLNVVEPGRLAFITGSSHLHLGLSHTSFHRKGIFGTYPNAVIDGLHTVEGGQISTGSIVKWFETHFLGYQDREAREKKKNLYELMEDLASKVPIGSGGLIVLDSFQGNRTPLVDPTLRGAMWGLSLHHRPEHVYRAILEGISYGTEFIFRQFREAGYEVRDIYACGGPTRSKLWMQIHSDVSGVPIQIPLVQDAPLLGSAILAGVAAGLYPDVREAAAHMVKIRDRVEPNREHHEMYAFYLDAYIKTYDRLADLMHDMTAHTADVK